MLSEQSGLMTVSLTSDRRSSLPCLFSVTTAHSQAGVVLAPPGPDLPSLPRLSLLPDTRTGTIEQQDSQWTANTQLENILKLMTTCRAYNATGGLGQIKVT